MGNTTFRGVVRSTEGFKHVSIADATGTETETAIVNSSGEVVADVSGPELGDLAGAGITDGTGTVIDQKVTKVGKVINTQIFIDLTGLDSSTTDLDIIGTGLSAAYLTQITAARNGQIFDAQMTCLEVPAGGVTDVDLYSATENTGVFDGAVADLAETAIITGGAAWTLNKAGTPADLAANLPAADEYLYLTGGAAGTAATYTAGQFLIELWGYEA